MRNILQSLTSYPIKTRLSLSGTLIVARDIAHAKLQERLDSGEGLPQYIKDHPVYYAGPAKTPEVIMYLSVSGKTTNFTKFELFGGFCQNLISHSHPSPPCVYLLPPLYPPVPQPPRIASIIHL